MVINKKHSELIFTDDIVVKTTSPELMRIEYEKHKRAYEIGKESGLFRVPEIYEYEPIKGRMTLEYMNDIEKFESIKSPSNELIYKIGKSLAIIHKNLSLPEEIIIQLPKEFVSCDEVFLHGDFNGANVCIDKKDGSIVILDWQMAPGYGGRATFGTRLFDLTWFATYNLIFIHKKDLNPNRAIEISNLFIKSYIDESNPCFSNLDLINYIQNYFQLISGSAKKSESIRHYLLKKYSIYLRERFLKSLSKG
jgi:hypothetical protein